MPTAYRLLGRPGGPIGDADSIDEALELAGAAPPGRYRLIKFYLDRATGELRCWEWGTITRGHRGELRLEIPPRDA